jgi:predicted TPR repeat methyltransferase
LEHYKESFQVFDRQASAYQGKFMGLDIYDSTYDLFCSYIKKQDAEILDIACGPGNISSYLLFKNPGYRIWGVDLSPNMVALAQKNIPLASFSVMDCMKLSEINKKFDALACGFFIPYLSKEECSKLMAGCNALLNPGGVFYFSLIEGKHHDSGYELSSDGKEKAFVYYYDEDTVMKMTSGSGFQLLDLKRTSYMRAGGKEETHLVFIVRKP